MIKPIRHKAPEGAPPFAGPTPHLKQIADHYHRYFGTQTVWAEIASVYTQIAIYIAEPTNERPFFTLLTTGMSSKAMATPEGHEDKRYCELMLCLPPTWPYEAGNFKKQESFKKPENFWPIKFLKYAARFPHQYNAWLWWSQTLISSNPPVPMFEGAKFAGGLVATPVLTDDKQALKIPINDEKMIQIFSYIPLHADEVEFYLKYGAEPLGKLLSNAGVTELVDFDRPSVIPSPTKRNS